MIELHTGCFANALEEQAREVEIARLKESAVLGHSLGLQVNAGHGINYENVHFLNAVPHLSEFNIGHTIIARSVRVGLTQAVAEMKKLMEAYSPEGC